MNAKTVMYDVAKLFQPYRLSQSCRDRSAAGVSVDPAPRRTERLAETGFVTNYVFAGSIVSERHRQNCFSFRTVRTSVTARGYVGPHEVRPTSPVAQPGTNCTMARSCRQNEE